MFLLVAVLHLLAQLLDATGGATDATGGATSGAAGGVVRVTQWLLMPLLAAAFAIETAPARPARRDRLAAYVLAALGFSWLGDAAPDLASGDTAFLVKVGFFLIAQLLYIAAFRPYRADSVLTRRPGWLLCYLAAIAALVLACAPHAGPLLVPVLVYGGCLGTMAVLSTGVDLLTGIGGAVFLVSDGLIALQAFVPDLTLPAGGFWVMASYLAAQTLITLGVLRRRAIAAGKGPLSPAAGGRHRPRWRTAG